MLALAAMQGFIRPDLIVAAHLGILVVCMTRMGSGFPLSRAVQAATSVLAVLIAGGIQFYLMHVVYPQATYGTTPVFELGLNLTQPLGMVPVCALHAAVGLAGDDAGAQARDCGGSGHGARDRLDDLRRYVVRHGSNRRGTHLPAIRCRADSADLRVCDAAVY